eukprot:5933219-Prymnesium_polylepis.2
MAAPCGSRRSCPFGARCTRMRGKVTRSAARQGNTTLGKSRRPLDCTVPSGCGSSRSLRSRWPASPPWPGRMRRVSCATH